MAEFKPNIYPIMYWGLLYGLVAGFVLLLINFLSQYLTVLWFPVFLAGVAWGGYRNYQKQKRGAGVNSSGSALEEIRAAASDIVDATKEMIQQPEEMPAASPFDDNQSEEEVTAGEEEKTAEENQPNPPPPPPPLPPQP